jgi:DNA-binding Xre family transcriptional regulator
MGSLQAQRLHSLLLAQNVHDEAQAAVEKCVAAGALSSCEAATQQAQAAAALKSARAQAGLASKDTESKGEDEDDFEPGKPNVEGGVPRRGRQPGQKIGKYAARTRIDDLSIDTLRAVCNNLGLTREASEAEMTASIHKASGATAKIQKTNLDTLSVETLQRICAERKLNVDKESDKLALIEWIQNGAAPVKKGARDDENKPEEGTIQQPAKAKARPQGMTKKGKESAAIALATEDKPKKVRAATSYNLFMKEEIARLKGADLSLEHKLAFKQAAANWAAEKHPAGAGIGDDAPEAGQQGDLTDTKCSVLQVLEEYELPDSDDEDNCVADEMWSEVGYKTEENSGYRTFLTEKQGYTDDDAYVLVGRLSDAACTAVSNARRERGHKQLR